MLRDGSTASIWEEMQGLTATNEQEEGHVRGRWEGEQRQASNPPVWNLSW